MTQSPAAELGEFLSYLKRRSNRSYEWIGRRVNAGRSTVQRYCVGDSVPAEFATLERIARLCGAANEEIAQLFGLWIRATAAKGGAARTAETETETETGACATQEIAASAPLEKEPLETAPTEIALPAARFEAVPFEAVPADLEPPATTASGRPRHVRWWLPVAVVGTALLAVLVPATLSAGDGSPSSTAASGLQWIDGPAWTRPPTPVPTTLFGVTLNSSTGTMPSFRVGAVRLWDSGTRWAQVEPGRGEYDWTVLDRHVAGAQRAGLPVLYVFGGTPDWASPTGAVGPYPDGTRAAPPDDLAEWDAFVRALAERYDSRIDAYELWVLGNDRRFFAGDVETLVEMTRRASGIIRSVDQEATLVCPGMGNLWSPEGRRVMTQFAELGGYSYCDVAGIKLHQRSAAEPPETMLSLAATADRLLHEVGIHPPLWNTGTTYDIRLESGLAETTARNYAVRFFLVGIYARDLNLRRMYFYSWGSSRIPLVLQAEGGAPTGAALAVEQLERWLAHASSRSCGHGLPVGLPANVWQCTFSVTGPDGSHEAVVRWTDRGTASTTAGPGAQAVKRLDGSSTSVGAGEEISVTEEPVLIELSS